MRVLVVEDEKRLAAGLRNGLEADGFAVDVALDGTDGLWLARENSYDAIVLDIMLPGVNGFVDLSDLAPRASLDAHSHAHRQGR
ncbi:MAG: response regulator [Geodermatophilaceae bacterium]